MAEQIEDIDDQDSNMNSDDQRRKKLVSGTQKLVEGAFPSDEELQQDKQADASTISKLRDRGVPDLIVSAAQEASGATPSTRKDYMQGLAVPAVGSVEKTAAAPLFSDAVAKGEAGTGASNFAKYIRGGAAGEQGAAESSASKLSSLADKGPPPVSAGSVEGQSIPTSKSAGNTLDYSGTGQTSFQRTPANQAKLEKLRDEYAEEYRMNGKGSPRAQELEQQMNDLTTVKRK